MTAAANYLLSVHLSRYFLDSRGRIGGRPKATPRWGLKVICPPVPLFLCMCVVIRRSLHKAQGIAQKKAQESGLKKRGDKGTVAGSRAVYGFDGVPSLNLKKTWGR